MSEKMYKYPIFGLGSCTTTYKRYKRSELNRAIRRKIKIKEKQLGRTCRMIWDWTNKNNVTYLFGSFCRNYDKLPVTIGYYDRNIGRFRP